MDPLSTSVAFIGFAASLTTLAALVINSSKILYKVRSKLKDAPEDIRRLYRQLKEFECLLSEIQERIRDYPSEYAALGMETLFTSAVHYMHQDLGDFESSMLKLKDLLLAPASRRKYLALRIRYVLQEDRVQRYQYLISSHVGTLTLLVGILTR